MTRDEARALVVATLVATGSYATDTVYDHQPDSFGGQSPVATTHGRSLSVNDHTQGEIVESGEVWVLIYAAREREGFAIDPQEVEDLIDQLTRNAMKKLRKAFVAADPSLEMRLRPSESGYQIVDGTLYRTERFAVPFQEFSEDE